VHTRTDLEYSYEPRDFFEVSTALSTNVGTVAVDAGTVIVTLLEQTDPIDRAFVQPVTDIVRGIFHVRQLVDHREFTLRGPNVVQHRPDGLRDIVLLAEPARMEWRGYAPDILITDAEGNVIKDTRGERIRSNNDLLERIAPKISLSPLLKQMLRSYSEAVSDSSNELVHLYEIRDAVQSHFGDEGTARRVLAVSTADWTKLGRLANIEPVREGRHRGRQLGPLREATEDELEAARQIARRMIESFANTL
jgi:hypothetical protein